MEYQFLNFEQSRFYCVQLWYNTCIFCITYMTITTSIWCTILALTITTYSIVECATCKWQSIRFFRTLTNTYLSCHRVWSPAYVWQSPYQSWYVTNARWSPHQIWCEEHTRCLYRREFGAFYKPTFMPLRGTPHTWRWPKRSALHLIHDDCQIT